MDNEKVNYPCLFTFSFSNNILLLLFNMLSLYYREEDWLIGDVYFRPPITIRSHDLHVGNMKRVVGEINSYHEKD